MARGRIAPRRIHPFSRGTLQSPTEQSIFGANHQHASVLHSTISFWGTCLKEASILGCVWCNEHFCDVSSGDVFVRYVRMECRAGSGVMAQLPEWRGLGIGSGVMAQLPEWRGLGIGHAVREKGELRLLFFLMWSDRRSEGTVQEFVASLAAHSDAQAGPDRSDRESGFKHLTVLQDGPSQAGPRARCRVPLLPELVRSSAIQAEDG